MISIIQTGISNLGSVIRAVERTGVAAQVTRDPERVLKSSHVILPGVGSAQALMSRLREADLVECIRVLRQPVLGICLGMQAFYEFSNEGAVDCLGIFSGKIELLETNADLPVPHMGWNRVQTVRESLLLKGIPETSDYYFVHSFRAPLKTETVAIASYGIQIPAVIETGNWFGTQFHPEKSSSAGQKLIQNFINL